MQAEASAQAIPASTIPSTINVRPLPNHLMTRPDLRVPAINAIIPNPRISTLLTLCVCIVSILAFGSPLVAQTGNVVISTNTTYATGTYNLTSLTVQSGATLTIGGGSTLNVSGTILVTANSNIVLQGANTSAQVNGAWAGVGSTINAATVEVDAGSTINADAQGYTASSGPGAASGTNGGSYGGAGGGQATTTTYGSDTAPTDLGSGGGSYESTGGTGGGALRLIVSGTLTNNGIISADGGTFIVCTGSGACGGGFAGGGAGGSVYATAGTLVGSGTFHADGGPNATGYGGGGGGGRVAVYYNLADNFSGAATSTAAGGTVGTGGAPTGSAGTVGFFGGASSGNNGALIVDQPFTIPAGTTAMYTAITVQNGATLTVGGGSTVNVSGAVLVTANSNIVLQGANTSAQVNGAWAGVGSTISAATIEVDKGSSINADAQGYTASNGPGGAASGTEQGGSYGGAGGGQAATTTYGLDTAPVDLGSGGGSYESTGGTGGGAMHLIVSGTLTNNGIISANGGTYIVCTGSGACGGGFAGGGAGGSVDISAGGLAGSGTFNANGGPNTSSYGNGGGGGRVVVYYGGSPSTFAGFTSSTASGGVVPTNNGALVGSVGTIAFFNTSGTNDSVMVYQNFALPAASNLQYDSLTVTNGATLTVGGGTMLNVTGAVQVTGNSTLVLQGANTSAQVNGSWQGAGVTVNAASIQVDSGSSINADGQGYMVNAGPGGAPSGSSAGGSYGGMGGLGENAVSAAPIYGSDTTPTDLGSGGGSRCCGAIAGPGGGAIRMIVSGTLTDNGVISANGANLVGYQGGGGAGGSIYATTASLAGSGVFTANGGTGGEAAGGGGRIAVYYTAPSSSFSGFATSTANGGSCGTQCTSGTASAGGTGTVAFFDTSATNTNLMVDQDFTIPANSTVSYNSITVQPGAVLTIGGGATLKVADTLTVSGTVVAQSINNSAMINGTWQGSGVNIRAATVVVNAKGSINADNQGYVAGAGPGGAPASSSAGGSYGGLGGVGDGVSPAGVYGSTINPTDLGSGGNTRCCSTVPGAGGGALTLTVAGTLTDNGVISANGGDATGLQVGGGSGGTVSIQAGTITGSGGVAANGGMGGEAGGGGGRVALRYTTNSGFDNTLVRSNAGASSSGNPGSAGSVYILAGGSNLIVSDNTPLPANATLSYTSITVNNQGVLTLGTGTALTSNTVTVSGGGLFNVGGGSNLNISGSVLVTANSNIVLQSINNATQVNSTWQGAGATLKAGSIQVDAGSTINADGQGYLPSAGPGGAPSGSSAGGSYGGLGGVGDGVVPGGIYGSTTTPTDLGSGGGYRCCSAVPGPGGGAVRLIVSGTLTDNGVISANGINEVGYQGGGGSGGSVYITTAGLAGSGVFTANGGTGGEAGGGGGRIAVYYNAPTSTFTGFETSTANGGSCGTQCSNGTSSAGSVGTAAFFDTSSANDNLMVDQDLTISPGTSVTYNSITVQPGALLTIGGGATVTVTNLLTVNGTLVAQSLNNSALVNGTWQGTGVTINAANVLVNANGSINADGQGYIPSAGPGGAPAGTSAGGSYGGLGGAGNGVASAGIYGSATLPVDLGSGGGLRCCSTSAGAGGGALFFNVSGTLTNNGVISANGAPIVGYQAGGGSGGTVYVKTAGLSGSGAFTANGGLGGEAGGGGGRVAVYYDAPSSNFTGFSASTASGGGCGTQCTNATASPGSNGTAAFFDTSATNNNLAIYQNFVVPAGSSPTYNSVNVQNGALLTIGGGATLTTTNALTVSGTVVAQSADNTATINDVWVGSGVAINAATITVNANGSLNADTQGYIAGAGPGGAPAGTSAGGSYGGLGGVGNGSAPSPTYGSLMLPVDLGSGGGTRCCGTIPGPGGGALVVTVSGTLTDNGVISANGADGSGAQVGGGAGGSVQIHTATLAGSGSIAANGGAGGEAGGGGGRIALYFTANSFDVALATATGGTSSGGNAGALGTVYIPSKVTSTTALSVPPATLTVGQTATFQALVTSAAFGPTQPGPTPTGVVTFFDGTTIIGTQALTAAAVSGTASAQFQTATLSVGTHTITASYAGDQNVKASASAPQTVTIGQATPTTSLAVSAASITAAQSETLTATVAGLLSPAITGNVTFFDGTTSLGNRALTVSGGTGIATLSVPSLSVGTHGITARYNGDTNYIAITSAAQSVTVSQITSTIRLGISAAIINAGQSETLTATIAGAVTPVLTGVVTFFDGTSSIGTGNVAASSTGGTATLTLTTLAAGTRTLTAHYGGDTNYTASISGAQTVTVAGTPQTITFPAIPNHKVGDAPFALNATASSELAVSYSVVSGPATVSGSTVTLAGSSGTVTIQATQAGNTIYAAATPVSQSFIVSAPIPTLVSISPAIGIVGSGATTLTLTGANFAVTDTVQANGTALPTTLVSATTLTATLPASFFAEAGTGLITIADSASESITAPATFTIVPAPQFVLTGPATTTSGEQPTLTFTLTNPFPYPLAGALTLTFAPVASAGIVDDETLQFATGGRTIAFNIPANSTATPAVQLQAGTVAGTATVTLAVTSAGVNVTPANVAPVVIVIPAAVPTLNSAKTTRSGQTLTVAVVGYSNTREITKAVFHFTSVDGSTIKDPDVTVDVTTVFGGWYGSTESDAYGSAFTYTQPFTLDSDAASIASVTVTLQNSVGASIVVTAQ